MLSELESILNDLKGKIFNPDYDIINKTLNMSKDPSVSKEAFEKQIIISYIVLSEKIVNNAEYTSSGKIVGIKLMQDVRDKLKHYINNNDLNNKYRNMMKIFRLGSDLKLETKYF